MKGCQPHSILLLTSPSPRALRLSANPIPKEHKNTRVSHNVQFSTGLHPNKMTATPTLNITWVESAHRPHTTAEHGPLHTGNESVFVLVLGWMFLFPPNWNVRMVDECRSDGGGYSNVRGLSHTLHSPVSISRFSGRYILHDSAVLCPSGILHSCGTVTRTRSKYLNLCHST